MTTNTTDEKIRSRKWANIGIIFSCIAIIILLIVFYLGYFYLDSANQHMIRENRNLQTNVGALRGNIQETQQQVQQLKQELQKQQVTTKDLNQVISAEYLVKMAQIRSSFDNDSAQTLNLLQMAAQEVKNLPDPRLEPVRQALAADIANIQSVPQVNKTELYFRLIALNDQIDKIPLPDKLEAKPVTAPSQALSWWRRGLHETWQALRQIVIIRHNTEGMPPFVSPEQKQFFYLNAHAELEQAIWALLRNNEDIYRSSLQQTANWIQKYAVTNDQVTQTVLKNLNELLAIKIRSELPKLNASLQAFQGYFNTP
jgi:uroporphyrin-3 C-methyltransferase